MLDKKNLVEDRVMPVKECRTCCIEKNVSEFYPEPKNKDGYRNECKECKKAKSRVNYDAYAEKTGKKARFRVADEVFQIALSEQEVLGNSTETLVRPWRSPYFTWKNK